MKGFVWIARCKYGKARLFLSTLLLLWIVALSAGCGGGTSGTRIERILIGVVQDPQGTAVTGVVITDGINSTESDADGNFTLTVGHPGESVEIGAAAPNTVEPVFTETVNFGNRDNLQVIIELRDDGITITPAEPVGSSDPLVQTESQHEQPVDEAKDRRRKEDAGENDSPPDGTSPTPTCEANNSCPLPPETAAFTYEVNGVLTDGMGLSSGVEAEISIEYLSTIQSVRVETNSEGRFTGSFELPQGINSSEVVSITISFYADGTMYGPYAVPVEVEENRYHFSWQGEGDRKDIVFFDGRRPRPTGDAEPAETDSFDTDDSADIETPNSKRPGRLPY